VTEALSIAGLPSEIRDQCRRADIGSKSLLLQIARQPDDESMKIFIRRVAEQGMTRDEARRARTDRQARPQPYVFRHQPETKEYTLELRFRRSSVSRDEMIVVLESLLAELRAREN
jgi:ParB family chromosome partitioning protein